MSGALRTDVTLADLPDRVIVDQHGHYWRDYGSFYSMCPVSDENTRTELAAVYVRAVRVESRDGSGPARYVPSKDVALAAHEPVEELRGAMAYALTQLTHDVRIYASSRALADLQPALKEAEAAAAALATTPRSPIPAHPETER